MFGPKDDTKTPEKFELPPLAAISVTQADGTIETTDGHQLEMTNYGGLNIHRIYPIDTERVYQKIVVGYAPGEWKKVTQVFTVPEASEPTRIVH